MQTRLLISLIGIAASTALAQGTFIYDQQSSTDEIPPFLGSGGAIQAASPYGQSFTPNINSLDFIRLKLNDQNPGNSPSVSLHLDLRAGSISGGVLGSSAEVTITNNFAGVVTFFFSGPVSITPGAVYVFQPVIDGSGFCNIDAGEYNYPGGTAIYQGSPLSGSDVWFREGVTIPEPSVSWILVMGTALLASCRIRKRERRK